MATPASRLKLTRVAAGLTQFEVFRRSGISPGRLSLLERGLISPRAEELAALARALKCDVGALRGSPTLSGDATSLEACG